MAPRPFPDCLRALLPHPSLGQLVGFRRAGCDRGDADRLVEKVLNRLRAAGVFDQFIHHFDQQVSRGMTIVKPDQAPRARQGGRTSLTG